MDYSWYLKLDILTRESFNKAIPGNAIRTVDQQGIITLRLFQVM